MAKRYVWKYKGHKIISIWNTSSKIRKKKIVPVTQASGICFTLKGKILIIKNKNKWHLPGGHPLLGESLLNTLKREVLEEASVKLKKCALIGYSEIFFSRNPSKLEGKHYYQARCACLISQVIRMKKDPATGILFKRKFIRPQEFLNYIKWKNAGEMLTEAIEKFREFTQK